MGNILSPFHKFGVGPGAGLTPPRSQSLTAARPHLGPGAGQVPGPAFITCNCGQTFASLSQLERHMSTEHPENTNLVSTN